MGTVAGNGPEGERRAEPIPEATWCRIERRLDEYSKERIKRKEERDERNKERLARGLKPLKPLKWEHALPLEEEAFPQHVTRRTPALPQRVTSPDEALRATVGEALARFRAAPEVL